LWPSLYTPKGTFKYENLNHRITQLPGLIQELVRQDYSGILEILAPHEKGLLVFHHGVLYNSFYEGTQDLKLSREQILTHFFQTKTAERDTLIQIIELPDRVVEALGALQPRPPAHRELETSFLDLPRLLDTFRRKHFTGSLRFYRIRNNTRLGNLLVRLKKITPEQLQEAVRLQLSGEGALRLGDALVKIKAVSPEDLKAALDRQALTRKGSDVEIALALFWRGEWLGGFQGADGELVTDPATVIAWVNVPEMFMDIIDGRFPEPVDLASVLPTAGRSAPVKNAGEPGSAPIHELPGGDDVIVDVRPDPGLGDALSGAAFSTLDDLKFTSKESTPSAATEYRPSAEDGSWMSRLSGEVELLEMQEMLVPDAPPKPPEADKAPTLPPKPARIKPVAPLTSAKAAPAADESAPPKASPPRDENQPPTASPAPPATGTVPVPSTKPPEAQRPLPEAAPPKEPEPAKRDEPAPPALEEPPAPANEPVDPDVANYLIVRDIVDHYMGFLGRALLEQEYRKLALPGRPLNPAQLRLLCQNLQGPAGLLVGPTQALHIVQHLRERLKV